MNRLTILLFSLAAFVQLSAQASVEIYPFSYEDRWGLIDNAGQVVLAPSLDEIQLFWDNKQATGSGVATKDERQGLLNGYGKWIVKPKLDSIVARRVLYAPELHWVFHKGKFGLLTTAGKRGKWLVKPRFTAYGRYGGSAQVLLTVAIGDGWGVVNREGEIIADCIYDEVHILGEYDDEPYARLTKDGVVTYLDATGEVQDSVSMQLVEDAEAAYEDMEIYAEEIDGVPEPRKQIRQNESGETVITYEIYEDGVYQVENTITVPAEYRVEEAKEETNYYPRGIRYVHISKDGKQGFMDRQSQICTPAIHDRIVWDYLPYSNLGRGDYISNKKLMALLYIGNKQGLASYNGRQILPAIFDRIEGHKNLLLVTHESGYRGYADYNGNIFLPSTLGLGTSR